MSRTLHEMQKMRWHELRRKTAVVFICLARIPTRTLLFSKEKERESESEALIIKFNAIAVN